MGHITRKLMEYAFTDYNTVRPHSSIDYLPPDEFERRLHEEDGFRDKFLEDRKRKEEKRMKNRIERKRRLKENVSLEDGMHYLMSIKDCFSKKWISYEFSKTCTARDCIRAVEKAYAVRFPHGGMHNLIPMRHFPSTSFSFQFCFSFFSPPFFFSLPGIYP